MMRSISIRAAMAALAAFLALAPVAIRAETPAEPYPADQSAPAYTPQQIDQLLAPIALYPDTLLSQILMASTYPLEVIQAARWLQQPANAALQGDQLVAALDQFDWDPSVKALVSVPRVLQMMNGKLDWMEQLGDAFLAQEDEVMESVQRLRREARAAGNLTTTPQQVVVDQGPNIIVRPARPEVIYVPYYDPLVVYGPWPYAAYPPYFFPPPLGYVYGPPLYFGFGFAIAAPLWGWVFWNWDHHYLHINVVQYNRINRHGIQKRYYRPARRDRWEHNPFHRRGVAYRDVRSRERFTRPVPGSPDRRRVYRGYDTIPAPNLERRGVTPRQRTERPATTRDRATASPRPGPRREAPTTRRAPAVQNQDTARRPPASQRRPEARQAPTAPRAVSPTVQRPAARATPRPSPPAFEGISRGGDVRAQSNRGRQSQRAITVPPRAQRNAPSGSFLSRERPGGSAPSGRLSAPEGRPLLR